MIQKLIAAIFLASATAIAAFGGQKLASDLNNLDPRSTAKVIVNWKTVPNATHHARVAHHGGHLVKSFSHLRSSVYSVPASELRALSNDPDIEYIAPDRPLHGLLDLTAAATNAPVAWSQGFVGTGIGVAVIDSGFTPHPDISNSTVVYSQDFTGEYAMGTDVASPSNAPDMFGHGEHVTGIIAGDGQSSQCQNCTRTLSGLAPGVSIVNLRALDENGSGSDSTVIAAIDEAIQLQNTYNIKVINLSIGRPVFESYTQDPLCQAVEQAWQAGIVVVVAAGNDGRDNSNNNNGYGTITAPGNDPYVITVGAMKTMGTPDRSDDLVASYSSKGPSVVDSIVKPDLVAPGNLVVSLLASPTATLPATYPSNIPNLSYYMNVSPGQDQPSNVYFNLSGTSMATPVVSAAAADLLQAQPSLTPDQVKAILMMTAYKTFPASSTATDPTTGQTYVDYYDPFTVGAGYVDIAAALANTNVPQGDALSPAAVYDANTNSAYLVFDNNSVWLPAGTQSALAVSSVWAVGPESASWGQKIVATSASWGQKIVATSASWGQKIVATSANWCQKCAYSTSTTSAQSTLVTIKGEQ